VGPQQLPLERNVYRASVSDAKSAYGLQWRPGGGWFGGGPKVKTSGTFLARNEHKEKQTHNFLAFLIIV
jgi:hypothetical protein